MEKLYTAKNGVFYYYYLFLKKIKKKKQLVFATIIAQSGCISVFVYINRLGDLFVNYLSPYLTYNRRNFQNEGKNYFRNTDSVF